MQMSAPSACSKAKRAHPNLKQLFRIKKEGRRTGFLLDRVHSKQLLLCRTLSRKCSCDRPASTDTGKLFKERKTTTRRLNFDRPTTDCRQRFIHRSHLPRRPTLHSSLDYRESHHDTTALMDHRGRRAGGPHPRPVRGWAHLHGGEPTVSLHANI